MDVWFHLVTGNTSGLILSLVLNRWNRIAVLVNEPKFTLTEGVILRDMLESDENTTSDLIASVQQTEMLRDIMESIADIAPMLRSIINEQGGWNLDRLEEQMKEMLDESPAN